MKIVQLSENDIPEIENFLRTCEFVPIQQSPIWAKFQKTVGINSIQIGVREANKLIGFVQIFTKSLPLGLKWLHVPRGPLTNSTAVTELIFTEVEKIARVQKAIFIHFDFQKDTQFSYPKFRPAKETNYPKTTLVLDLRKSEDEILAAMKPKGRYNIRVAQRHGVRIRKAGDSKSARIFFELLRKTTARDNFHGHSKDFYVNFLKILNKNACCFIAEIKGKPVAASIVTFFGDTATYYYGASDYSFRNLMAPYAIQFAAILTAKQRGCHFYDFLGIAPENTKNHPLAGVTSFKKKFGGKVISYPISAKLILRPGIFSIYQLFKKIRRQL